MPPTGALVFIALLFFFLGLYGSLSFCFPQLAFRLENIFQLRSVELSGFGLFIHKAGGIVLIGAALLMPLHYDVLETIPVSMIGIAIPPLYFKRTRGVFIVQTIFDPAIEASEAGLEERNRP